MTEHPMTLLERYLRAVRFFLPRAEQDDIVRELSENLDAEIEDRAMALGRDLTEVELADILRRHGHPMVVAARYGPRRHLIGPALFPFYTFVLKVGLVASLVIAVVLAVIDAALHGDAAGRLVAGMLAYPGRALLVFAWTTLVFAVLDVAGSQKTFATDWDPRRIPDWMVGASQQHRVTGVVEVVFGLLAVGWLVAVPAAPWLALGPLAGVLQFAPVWRLWFVPLVLVTALSLALDVRRVVRPRLARSTLRAKVWVTVLQVLLMIALLSAGEWVRVRPHVAATPGRDVLAIAHWVNVSFGIGLASVAIISLIEIAKQIYRLRTRPDEGALAGAARRT